MPKTAIKFMTMNLNINMFKQILFLIFLVLMVGCMREQRPEGMPTLYPCTITIIQDGKPLAGAMVTLYTESSEDRRWPPGGTTNPQGVISIKVLGKYSGAPAGTYKVTVEKQETENVDSNSYYTISLVETQYINVQDTPLKIDVTPQGVNQTFDVGKPVQKRISDLIKIISGNKP
ncbi:MAG: carboxypeptidase-like regulatory domain-containing protein [Planctomycetaceae bacterium]|jgi:5-hydroxyisourate hydrolase-like protein (transthyretin family)|nr:carboxypeptidase-like regulatory domain-containing protein [Planctomycetaceae bacterium]